MTVAASGASDGRAVLLLAAQAFALGLTVAWITIPASAIFLEAYGAGTLPFTYIGAAAAGVGASALLNRAFRRRSLMAVTSRVLGGFAVTLAVTYALLRTSGDWVSVFLLVLIPIVVPVGFMFVVGQAGTLLDVRALKSFYPRVIAGFALGLVAGGLASPAAIELLGRTDGLLAAASVVALAFLLLARTTERTFSAQLSAVEASGSGQRSARPTLASLMRNRYVLAIASFQMLSAAESQWLDFLVYDRAAQRYDSSEALAGFIGTFTAITYATDIVFLLLVAGVLMRRFGLRYGLAANAIVVLVLVTATIVASSTQGATTTLAFVLVAASRASDLTLSDGATRTSLSAAYQAIPTAERLAAQATVEGLAVPLAIGLSGIVLIVIRATVGTSGIALPVVTSAVLGAWVVVALAVHRGYRTNLLTNLRRRTLNPVGLTIDDGHTLAAIERLLDSDDERDVRLGMQTIEAAEHPELVPLLRRLAGDERSGTRAHALERLATIDAGAAATSARAGLHHPTAAIRATSSVVLGRTGARDDLAAIVERWADHDHEVKAAAAGAIWQLGDTAEHDQLMADLTELVAGGAPGGAQLAARVMAQCEPVHGADRRIVGNLVRHTDPNVVSVALGAIRWDHDHGLFDDVVAHASTRRTLPAAVGALVGGGTSIVARIGGIIDDATLPRDGRMALIRACRDIGGVDAAAMLAPRLLDRDRAVGLAAARALAAIGQPAPPELDEMIRTDLVDATHAIRAMVVLGDVAAFVAVARAVADELQLLEQRLSAALAVRHGVDGMREVAVRLAKDDTHAHALALEWLDVTLAGDDRPFLALVEPTWRPEDRLRALERWFPLPPVDPADVLADLIDDPDDRWRRPWISSCALLAAADAGMPLDDRAPTGSDWIVAETFAAIRSGRRTRSQPG